MNKIRRKALSEIVDRLEELRSDLEGIKEEEEEYRDNMPGNLQGSERYDAADAACDNLDSALGTLEDAINYIEEAAE